MSALEVETIAPAALDAGLRAAWTAFAAADPALASPFFRLEYVLAAAEAAPRAGLAVIRRAGRVEGFLPFQRRGDALQPLGAPLTDYHGPVLRPGAEVDMAEVVSRLDAGVLCFTGLPARPAAPAAARQAMAADLSGGWDAYLARRRAAHPRFFKSCRRREEALASSHGPVSFRLSAEDDGALDWILARKRRQYQRTGQHDIFACGWTERLLRRLAGGGAGDFGPRFAVLSAGGRIVSAEMGLVAGGVHHLWFPAYDLEFARFAPGMLMTLRTLEAAAAGGVREVDFGAGGEEYKAYFADPARSVFEGRLAARPWRRAVARLAPAGSAQGLGRKVWRRLDVVSACETSLAGWARGLAAAARLKRYAGGGLLIAPDLVAEAAAALDLALL